MALANHAFALPPQPFPVALGAAVARNRMPPPVADPIFPVVYKQLPRGGGNALDAHGNPIPKKVVWARHASGELKVDDHRRAIPLRRASGVARFRMPIAPPPPVLPDPAPWRSHPKALNLAF